MNEYELVYIITPRKAPADVDGVVEWVGQQVAAAGGEVTKVNQWGRRRLAYPIDHHFEGTYVLAHVQLPPTGTVVLEAALHITDDVIRHMLTRGIVNPEGSAPPEYVGERPRFAPRAGAPAPGGPSEASEGASAEPSAEASAATAVAEPPAEAPAVVAEAPPEAPAAEAAVAEAPSEAPAAEAAVAEAPTEAPAAEAAVAEAPAESATAEAAPEAPAEAAEAAPSESVEAAVETSEAPADEAEAKPAQPAAE